jgi:hypothetical protein
MYPKLFLQEKKYRGLVVNPARDWFVGNEYFQVLRYLSYFFISLRTASRYQRGARDTKFPNWSETGLRRSSPG